MPDRTPRAASLLNPADPPERQREKLMTIAEVLMRRVEQVTDDSGAAYAQFQRAALLEDQVRARTRDLERALDLLNQSNARLADANHEAEAARRNLADAIETVQEGFALFGPDEVLVMCNSRFCMQMLDLRDHLRPGLAFDDYIDLVSRSRFMALPAGETPQDWAVRRRRRHQDRHVIFNVRLIWDRWLQVSEHRTANGGTVILQTDVTDIIRLEREERGKMLDDQARIIRATLDHISQGVCIFDSATRLVGWNARLGDLLAIPVTRFRPGVTFDTLMERFGAEASFGDGMTAEVLRSWASAKQRQTLSFELRRGPFILQADAQEMPDGGFVLSFTDITAERAARAALAAVNETLEARVTERTLELADALADAERANASRARFVAAASHDLLQPLSAAKLFIGSIPAEELDPAAEEAVTKAQNALVQVEGILGALLDISKLESGRLAVTPRALTLNRVLDPLREEFAAIAAAKGLRLTVMPSSAVVVSDPAYLRRILQNLIGNAVRYTMQGRVLVGVRRQGGLIRLEVRDTGPGIAEEDQDAIFREFHRLDAPASASEGMGLGLAIVERACAALGHPLGLQSEPGRGSCFMVQLARAEPGVEALPAPPRIEPAARPTPDRIVFLIENEPDLRRALGLMLEKWGMTVLDAANAEEAEALIEEIGILPDVFIVDQQLGEGRSGLDFLREIRARHPHLPVSLITAGRETGIRRACLDLGAELFLKPLDPRALESWLARLPTGM
ncbi:MULTISPECIES: PAS-domain containing protein [Gemmobacter]|jgi:signal transduction histidine kinase|uniref:histidine kinase n=2 Tax=Gemmobacter TaxID=204456 RepID=A0A2T6BAR2_9RHOB|nr:MULTISPECIES: PAS-domain containing protein [Gemmobacter]PTX53190.1 signal transduction histidine kinase [Gemmobacter caeni]TWJ05301.1 signal transduction histidine kinase [Gemmobacter caeni]GHC16846.1 hybrid sensor histidine kinase/response regulator [Gemmobacter nanjingensis]